MRLFAYSKNRPQSLPLRGLSIALVLLSFQQHINAFPVTGGTSILGLSLPDLGLDSGSGLHAANDHTNSSVKHSSSSYTAEEDAEPTSSKNAAASMWAADPSVTQNWFDSEHTVDDEEGHFSAGLHATESDSDSGKATVTSTTTKSHTHTRSSTSARQSTTSSATSSDASSTQSGASTTTLTKSHHHTSSSTSKASAAAKATATTALKPQNISLGHQFAADTLTDNKYARFRLTSNQASYGPAEVRADLRKMMAWAQDTGNLNKAQEDETVAAILSVAARYYPELPTRAIARVLMADIKAESDFQPRLVSPGRLDSGDSWGLMQVSPSGMSQELNLFQSHARTGANSFSWVYQPSPGLTAMAQPGTPNAGPLLDWATGEQLVLSSLTNEDLFRPWINIHVASWIQVNLARTSSQDPSDWTAIAKASQKTTITSQQLISVQDSGTNSSSGSGSGSRSSGSSSEDGFSFLSINIAGIDLRISSLESLKSTLLSNLATEANLLTGASLQRSVRSGLGSWVAGPATSGDGGFEQDGDDISAQYLRAISEAVGVVYGQTVKPSWLDGLRLNAGLVDYRP